MYLLRQFDEMLVKIVERTFLIVLSLNLPIFFDFSGGICCKELAIYSTYRVIRLIRSSTYQEFFLYIKHTKTKGNEIMFEIGGVRLNQ